MMTGLAEALCIAKKKLCRVCSLIAGRDGWVRVRCYLADGTLESPE